MGLEIQFANVERAGAVLNAMCYLKKQPNTGAAIQILRQCKDKLRVELWSRYGFGAGKFSTLSQANQILQTRQLTQSVSKRC